MDMSAEVRGNVVRRMGTQQQQFGGELAFRRRGLCVSGSAHVTVYLPDELKRAGLLTALDHAVRAVHSCNIWLDLCKGKQVCHFYCNGCSCLKGKNLLLKRSKLFTSVNGSILDVTLSREATTRSQ